MPRCSCAAGSCSCKIVNGPGTTVSGNGSQENPYTIAADATSNIQVRDTDTVTLELDGDGSNAVPFILRANAVVSMEELTDVNGPPASGDVLHWDPNADGPGVGAWVPGAPASATKVQVTDTATVDLSVTGDGSVATPFSLSAAVVGIPPALVTVADTPTLDMTVTGLGTAASPLILSGNVLGGGGGGGAQTALMKASYVRTGAVAVPSSTSTPVLFETALYPAVGINYNPATGLFTVPTAGVYMVVMTQSWAADTGGSYRQLRLQKNGAIFDNRNLPWPATAPSTYQPIALVRTMQLAAGDTLGMNAYSGGAATSLQTDAAKTFTAMEVYSLDTSPPLSTAAPGRDITGWAVTADFTLSGSAATQHPYQVDKHVQWGMGGTVVPAMITSANGQLTPAITIATITDPAARPRAHATFTWSNGSTVWGTGIINATDGTVTLQTCNRLSLNTTGQTIRLSGSWTTLTSPVPVSPPLVTSVWGQGDLTPANVGTDSTVGGYTYIDANGQLRTLPKPLSGLVAPYQQSAAFFSMQGGWVLNSGVRMLRYGPIVQLYWNMSPPSDISMTSTGDIGNITCAILGPGVPPPLMAGHMWHGTFSGGSSMPVGAISTGGNVVLGATQIGSGVAWSAGAGRDYGAMYFCALDAP